MQSQRNGVIGTAEDIQGKITETAQTVADTAADLGSKAQQYASEAGRQATAAAQTAYGAARSAYSSGNDMLDVVETFARDNVWGSLLIAGVVGYGLACLIKQR